jgi:transcriptional regulator with GAF, ATPase, and Fis domain
MFDETIGARPEQYKRARARNSTRNQVSGRLWFRYCGQDRTNEPEVRNGLATAGVVAGSLDPDAPGACGILCFQRIDPEVFGVLHDVRRHACRVLALAASPMALDKGSIWRLLHAGAAEVLSWEGGDAAARTLARLERWCEVDDLANAVTRDEALVGDSAAWRVLVRKIVEAAHFTTAPVLVTGESGTGKELLARLVHAASPGGESRETRKGLVTVDCASIVPELSGSELFGHERGAFTGAHAPREGALALADGATLFLDEIGELPLPLQAQLLRAIQEKTYKRVGGNVWQTTNFRLVCATNRDLEELVRAGLFRLDLYHRISGWVFRTLPLREHREDILPLAAYFAGESLAGGAEFDDAVREFLLTRDYPGNVRELRQLVHRMNVRHVGPGPITAGDIPEEDRPDGDEHSAPWPNEQMDSSISHAIALGVSLREIGQAATDAAIRIAVQSEKGNLQRAAKRLGVTDRALQIRRASGKREG